MQNTTIQANRLYTVPEIGVLTGAGYHNIRRWIQRGLLRATRIGAAHAISGSDLSDTLARWQRSEIELDMPRHGSIKVPVLV
jgi:hypothetical protein